MAARTKASKSRDKRASGPSRRADRARSEIIEGAARAFAKTGYKATTMRSIASEAGFTASSLYQYFDSKEEIIGALVVEILAQLEAIFEAPTPESLDLRTRVELLLLRQAELLEKQRNSFAALFSLITSGASIPVNLQSVQPDPHFYPKRLARWLAANGAPGDLGDYSAEDAGFFLWSAQHAMFVRWIDDMRDEPFTDLVPMITRFFWNGIHGPE